MKLNGIFVNKDSLYNVYKTHMTQFRKNIKTLLTFVREICYI